MNKIRAINTYSKLAILFFLIFLFAPRQAAAVGASLNLFPNSGTFFVGSTFDVSLFINTGGNHINAVKIDLKFDPKKIQIASPTTGKSLISVWIAQPMYSNRDGTASFQGGMPSPGIVTSNGLISTITFRAISSGETKIFFDDTSQALLDDGKGTDVLDSMGNGVYNLVIPPPEGPEISSPTHPDQNKWYKNNNPTFYWDKDIGIADFSYDLNQDPQSVPDSVSEGLVNSISYTDIDGGIWYFNVKARKAGIWGGTSHYLLQIDNMPPAEFTPVVTPSNRTSNNQPIITFFTTDALSGFDHFEIKIINITPSQNKNEEAGFFIETASPYKLPQLPVGKYLIVIRAFDKAGNWRDASVKLEIIPQGIIFSNKGILIYGFLVSWWLIALVILIIAAVIIILSLLKSKRQRNRQLKIKERIKQRSKEFKNKIEYIKKPSREE